MIFICYCILNPSLLAGGSTKTMRSKKTLPHALHSRQLHSTMKGYRNWCSAMISASGMVETVSKNIVQYVYQMALCMVCNILVFFLNGPSEVTFWITYICNTLIPFFESAYGVLIFLQFQLSFISFTWIALGDVDLCFSVSAVEEETEWAAWLYHCCNQSMHWLKVWQWCHSLLASYRR